MDYRLLTIDRRLTVSAIAAALAISCAPVPAAKPPTPPSPIVRPLAVHTCTPGANVWLDGAGVPPELATPVTANSQGYALFPVFPGDVTAFNVHGIAANHAQFGEVVTGIRTGSGGVDFFLGDCEKATWQGYGIFYPLQAWPSLFTPLPPLHVEGDYLRLPNGDHWFGIENSDFSLFARWLDGEDIESVLHQRQAVGFNLLRVWTRFCHIPAIAGCSTLATHPDLYDRLPAFLRTLNDHGFYVDLLGYVGPNNEDDPQHWARLCTAVRGPPAATNVLLSLVNENAIHPIDLSPFHPCPGVLSSRGSNGSSAPFAGAPYGLPPHVAGWDWTEFHSNGRAEWPRVVGKDAWEYAQQLRVPIMANENTRMGTDGNDQDPAHAFDSMAGAAVAIAGAAFHSQNGKDSVLFDDATLALAKQAVAGAKSIPLSCQGGAYRHREDIEQQMFTDDQRKNGARVYQYGNDDACIARIRP